MSPPPTVLIRAPLPDFLLQPLSANYDCIYGRDQAELAALSPQCTAKVRALVMTGGATLPLPLLAQLQQLEIIAVNGVGYDGVPIAECQRRGIRVSNTPDVLTDDVADIALALLLMTNRELLRANQDLHAQRWVNGTNRLTRSVRGTKVGILGLGRIGTAIAARLLPCGAELGWHGRTPKQVDSLRYFPELLSMAEWADVLIVSCPGGSATQHLVHAGILRALGPCGTLINIARGSVVDETALVAALTTGQLGSVGLDVFEHEPNVPPALLSHPKAVLLPHVGSATQQTRQAMANLVLDNLTAHFSHQPLPTPVF